MKFIRHHLPSPALLVACVALLVALGGVSYAAGVLPKNSVGTVQLKKKAVTGAKLRTSAVTGAKVKDGTLMAADFKAGQLPAGPQGPKGDPGIQGLPGTARAYARVADSGQFTRSKNVAAVTHPNEGVYCITLAAGIDPSETGVVATPDFSWDSTTTGANKPTALVEWRSERPPECAGASFAVATLKETVAMSGGYVAQITKALADEPFFFVVP
jgi:hypothetical protein